MAGFRNLFHNASGQTADRAKFCALLPHSRQERLAVSIHERHAGQVDYGTILLVRNHLMPTGIEFLHPRTCQSSFKHERHRFRRRISMLGDLQHLVFSLLESNGKGRSNSANRP
jgi:hypothetical protein